MKPPDWLTDEETRCYAVDPDRVQDVEIRDGNPYQVEEDCTLGHADGTTTHGATSLLGLSDSPDSAPLREAWERLRRKRKRHLGIGGTNLTLELQAITPPDGRYFLVKRGKLCPSCLDNENLEGYPAPDCKRCGGIGKVTHHELVLETENDSAWIVPLGDKTPEHWVFSGYVDCNGKFYGWDDRKHIGLRFIGEDGQRWDVRRDDD